MVQAASHGSLSLLKQFVKWGADLNAPDMTDPWHPTALYEAYTAGHLEIFSHKFILEHGVDVNAKGGLWDYAPAAAGQGKSEVVEYLLNHGADPNAHDVTLSDAVYGGLEIVKMLIDKGANLQVQGEAALETASRRGELDIVKLLIEKGVSPKKGSILWIACYCGHLEVVKVLVENGADVDVLGGHWGTPLLAAIDGNEKEVVEFLIQSRVDVNATRDNSETPLQLAIQKGYKEIEDILRRHGARE
ncbi:ankyrin repeat-containing domain protein [Mycena floridula]|nr:ankyrin repeat-containing domain protein [Mycena floridula]